MTPRRRPSEPAAARRGASRGGKAEPKADYTDHGWQSFATMHIGETRWLFAGLLPLGELTGVLAVKQIGKTALLADWTARITAGEPMPGLDGQPSADRRPPGRVLWLTHEESEGALRNRFEHAGANLDLVGMLKHRAEGNAIAGAIVDMLPQIEAQLLRFTDWCAIFIEPITSYLQGVKASTTARCAPSCSNRCGGLPIATRWRWPTASISTSAKT